MAGGCVGALSCCQQYTMQGAHVVRLTFLMINCRQVAAVGMPRCALTVRAPSKEWWCVHGILSMNWTITQQSQNTIDRFMFAT